MSAYRKASPERRAEIRKLVGEYAAPTQIRHDSGYDIVPQPLLQWLTGLDDETFAEVAAALSWEIQDELVWSPLLDDAKKRRLTDVTPYLMVLAGSPYTPQDVIEYILLEYEGALRKEVERVVSRAAYVVQDEAVLIQAAWAQRDQYLLVALAERDLDLDDQELDRLHQLKEVAEAFTRARTVREITDATYKLAAKLVEAADRDDFGQYHQVFAQTVSQVLSDPDTSLEDLERLADWFWESDELSRLLAAKLAAVTANVDELIDDVESVVCTSARPRR